MNKFNYDLSDKRVLIAGSRGLVGSACVKRFGMEPCAVIDEPPRATLDYRNAFQTDQFIGDEKPDVIILAAAKVGGLMDNDRYPVDFLSDNLAIQNNIINSAIRYNVERLVFLGSSCIYPKNAVQPIEEDALMTGPMEETNRAYAIAKIAGVELIKAARKQFGLDYITLMPCNLYGSNDHFMNGLKPHVIPALMHRIKDNPARLEVWGTGKPLREFMHVDDVADAICFCTKHYSDESPLNIGSGEEISIADLASTIAEISGFDGEIYFDATKPDGVFRKCLDSKRLNKLGWSPTITLQEGLQTVWNDFVAVNRGQQIACQSG